MKLNLVNICLSIFLVFLIVFFLLLPRFRKSKIEALNGFNSPELLGGTGRKLQEEYVVMKSDARSHASVVSPWQEEVFEVIRTNS